MTAIAERRLLPPALLTRRRPPLDLLAALVAVVVVAVAIAVAPPPPQPGTVPTSPAVEQRYGIRLSQVAVTADGGLVDVRFVVLDEALAGQLTEDASSVPGLILERNGTAIRSAGLMGAMHLRAGRTAYLLYRNTAGAIRRGTFLTVDFGDLRIEHVVAG